MKKLILLGNILILISYSGIAQITQRCGTMEHLEMLISKDSSLQQRLNDNEIKIQQWISENKGSAPRDLVTIPVVVHVVWNIEEENILYEQIKSQIDVLNEDYSRSNADAANTPLVWQGIAANSNIQFCLANRDPSGNSTNGIVRVQTTRTSFKQGDKMKHQETGGANAWPKESYLNIWVCDLTTNLIGQEIVGFATFPDEASGGEDGVVVDYQAFGTMGTVILPYNKGRTATHEVGHWLNLKHIWGFFTGILATCSDDDGLEDTPLQFDFNETCFGSPCYDPCNTIEPGIMFMNFMDYTFDAGMNLFTLDQSEVMTATLNTTRLSLQSSMGCVEVPPVNSSIVWQKSYGGSNDDWIASIKQTTDGGYAGIGYSHSVNGDISDHRGGTDLWMLRLNMDGELLWQKSLGGYGDESISYDRAMDQTNDGGFIIAGSSNSNDSYISGNHGASDYLIIKMDESGEIEWQKCLGGSGYDGANAIVQTSDGGYIVAGHSNSNDGDVSGNHSGYDYWIVKLDAFGNLVWQKSLGGYGEDSASSIDQTSDGGYIVAGHSWSNAGGDITGNHGGTDYWIVRLNTDGNLIWQKSLGGSANDVCFSIEQADDGGFLMAGFSASNNNDVSGNHGGGDYWIVKLNMDGALVWEKTLGGSSQENAFSIKKSHDGIGYLVGGTAYSNDGDVSGNFSEPPNSWIIKIDLSGNLIWQKSFGGNLDDAVWSIEPLNDGGFVVGGYSNSNDGDVSGNHGGYDYWIVNITESDCENNFFINILDGSDTFCTAGSAILKMPIPNISYQWLKNGAPITGATLETYTATKTGDYSCIGSNSVCSGTSNIIHITVNKNPSATISPSGTVTMCAGNSTVLTASSTSTDVLYQWYKGNNPIAGATNATYPATKDAKYKCKITKTSTGCSAFTNKTTISLTCRLGNESIVSLYPNPAKDKITIELNYIENVSIQITDVTGKQLKIIEPTDFTLEFSVAELAQGLYFVNVLEANKLLQVEKFVKQ